MSGHRLCPTTGKRMLKRQEADRVVTIAARRSRGLAKVPASAYRCPACGKWHTTSMTQLEYQVIRLVGRAA
jgi:predicted RNA-binding Zn-ribbon protein involved in translation (DUF1610 family)